MSVLACDRMGCENVMCDRICHDRQEYLCQRCFEELVHSGPGTDLDTFMGCFPGAGNEEASRAYFNIIFVEM